MESSSISSVSDSISSIPFISETPPVVVFDWNLSFHPDHHHQDDDWKEESMSSRRECSIPVHGIPEVMCVQRKE